MDLFPPTYDFPMDLDDGIVYTDIHVDPASLPVDPPADLAPDMEAPAVPFVLSDEEMEEEDPEEDPEEEPRMDPTSDDDIADPIPTDEESSDHVPADDESSDHAQSDEDQSDPRSDDPTSPAAILPASPDATPSAIEPEIAPHTTSTYQRLSGPRVTRTARMRVRFPSTDYASTSRAALPLSPSPSSSTDIYRNTPHPAYTPSPTPSPARMSPLSAPNQEAPVSPRSPDPALFETTDPAISSLRDNAYAVGNRISQIERNLTEIPGPDSFSDLEGSVQQMSRRMDNMGVQMRAMERRLADQVRDLRLREGADRVEILNLRRRLQILEDQLSGMHI